MLRQYEQIIPQFGERLFAAFTEENTHRRTIERDDQRLQAEIVKRGQNFAFVLGLTALLGGMILAYTGRDVSGLGTMFIGVGALIAGAIWGRRTRKDEPTGSKKGEATANKMVKREKTSEA